MMKEPTQSREIWWLDIIVPLLLSLSFFAGMFFLVYSGQKHRRISSQMERRFIEFSLKMAGPSRSDQVDKIHLVSLLESDFKTFEINEINDFRDISIEAYANLIAKIIAQKPRRIYLNWVPSAHDPIDSYDPLIQELKKIDKSRIMLSLRVEHEQLIPDELLQYVSLVSNDSCLGRVQVVCSYGKKWDFWIPQNIANQFGPAGIDTDDSHIVTTGLPPMYPGYLLYLQEEFDFPVSSFSDVSNSVADNSTLFDKSVFVGNSLIQSSKDPKDYYLELGRVRTAISASAGDIRTGGVPFHVYWAQIAQMFASRKFVEAPSQVGVWILSGFFVSLTLFVLLRYGTALSLGFFLIFAVGAPFANALAVRYFHIYIPVFDSIFGGISSFLFASFGKISLSAYRKWWVEVQKKQDEESRDLKGNFISLISHNLNTPVAKMQGMLDLVEQYSDNVGVMRFAKNANETVAEMQQCIKSVLSVNAVDEGIIGRESVQLDRLRQELQIQFNNSLSRMGVSLSLELAEPDSDLNMLPVSIDRRIFESVIAGCAIMFHESSQNCIVDGALAWDQSVVSGGGVQGNARDNLTGNRREVLAISSLSGDKTAACQSSAHQKKRTEQAVLNAGESFVGGAELGSTNNIYLVGLLRIDESNAGGNIVRCEMIFETANSPVSSLDKAKKLFEKIAGHDRQGTSLLEEVSINLLKSFQLSNCGDLVFEFTAKSATIKLGFYA